MLQKYSFWLPMAVKIQNTDKIIGNSRKLFRRKEGGGEQQPSG
jgi:hypothetical protein